MMYVGFIGVYGFHLASELKTDWEKWDLARQRKQLLIQTNSISLYCI